MGVIQHSVKELTLFTPMARRLHTANKIAWRLYGLLSESTAHDLQELKWMPAARERSVRLNDQSLTVVSSAPPQDDT